MTGCAESRVSIRECTRKTQQMQQTHRETEKREETSEGMEGKGSRKQVRMRFPSKRASRHTYCDSGGECKNQARFEREFAVFRA